MNATIDRLDASLAVRGEDVVLQRKIGPNTDQVTVRAHVRSFRQQTGELVAGRYKQTHIVRISPTQIRAAGWPQHAPTPAAAPFNVDASNPAIGDTLIIKGVACSVKNSDPIALDGEVVRINMVAEG